MNGLSLRISAGGSKKTKNTLNYDTVIIHDEHCVLLGTKHKPVQMFLEASSVDEQLTNLKTILNSHGVHYDKNLIKFLVIVFLQSEVKHPVKCFLSRYITKSENLQQPFSVALSEEILNLMTVPHTTYRPYADVVGKVASCVENFFAGATAINTIQIPLAEYLKNGLTCVVKTLSEMKSLSPTEKNEVYNLAHSVLRLILYIAQKVLPENVSKLCSMMAAIRPCLKNLMFDEDVPMDTKSVCGIVYVSMQMIENNPDSWINVLKPDGRDEMVRSFLESEASRLCLYSAVATVVAMNKLQEQTVDSTPAIILLTASVIAVGERTSSDSTFNLAVARTLLQISKGLDKITDNALGLQLVNILLAYVWVHLDHYMDSVRHLSAQAFASVVRYCAKLQQAGDSSALDNVFTSLRALDRQRRSYYVSVTALAAELGTACVMVRAPDIVHEVMDQLHVQAVQASATTALETLLHKQANVPSQLMYERWIVPIMVRAGRPLESPELAILETLLTKAVKQDERVMDYILPHIKQQCDHEGSRQYDLKCVLMLLSVARKSGVLDRGVFPSGCRQWKEILGCGVLEEAAVSSLEQTRILSMSLVVESPKSTEVFTEEELDFVLYFLYYNTNAQAPNFRQLVLSLMKKFLKRFEDSYKALRRQRMACVSDDDGYYVRFLEKLRAQCFASLIPGANYGRRCMALQTLAWCELMCLEGYDRQWKEDYVEKLLLHLEDSYESNKCFALEILNQCPVELLQNKKYSTSLELGDILMQASSVKPTDCVCAAYKLSLLVDKLPENILQGQDLSELRISEPVRYSLLRRLVSVLRSELEQCSASVVVAARSAPMYGILHCITRVMTTLPTQAISKDEAWSKVVADLISTCIEVNAAVACVVNNSSPEGHLPMDMGGVVVTDHGNSWNVRLLDGRPVTAQMVLLCAWRSVKEVSLLLGCMCSRLEISSEHPGNLTYDQILIIGDHFTTLLAETKHRGAFEQAYVGFTSLLARLWRCRSPELHELPRKWLEELMVVIRSPHTQEKLCATRRSAGLPFMIQALVTTELQVRDKPTCFHACTSMLLSLARSGDVTTRTHCVNVLRALVRSAALGDAVAPHVGAGLQLALAGFDGTTWEERNSSTLLFSALMVRVFGVQRSRRGELCARNKMTGRIFFLRYPELYDLLLGKLEEVSRNPDSQLLRPALYPILLLLARLYPSSLEGTVSNLKLVAFIPHVLACARSADLRTRRLAAAAMLPLVSPDRYLSHLDAMLQLLRDKNIKRNYCHGILLQITKVLDKRPEDLIVNAQAEDRIREGVINSLWLLQQPCYVIANEYNKMINLLLWKFPTILKRDTTDKIIKLLDILLIKSDSPNTSGRAVCSANAAYLYFIILNVYNSNNLCQFVYTCLKHDCYEVVLSALNYILIMHNEIEIEDRFQEHLSLISRNILSLLNRQIYYELLCEIIRTNKYLECNQKALKVLTLGGATQSCIIQAKENIEITDDIILERLIYYVENEHDSLTHIYLQSLSNFIGRIIRDPSPDDNKILKAIRVIFASSSSDNSDMTRRVVVDFLDANIELLFALDLSNLLDEEKFEYKATLYSILVAMLEDDDPDLSRSTCVVISRAVGVPADVIPSKCAHALRDHIQTDRDAVALFTVLALLDFRSEVVMTDEGNDECRVFDQNERHNINLEETIWTRACAEKIMNIYKGNDGKLLSYVISVTEHSTYQPTLEKLCGNHLSAFMSIYSTVNIETVVINPKIDLFVSILNNDK